MPGLLFFAGDLAYCLAFYIVEVRGQNNFLCKDGIRYPADDWEINLCVYMYECLCNVQYMFCLFLS